MDLQLTYHASPFQDFVEQLPPLRGGRPQNPAGFEYPGKIDGGHEYPLTAADASTLRTAVLAFTYEKRQNSLTNKFLNN